MFSYRVGQFLRALWLRQSKPLPADAAALLSDREIQLFDRMASFEQAHSLAVYLRLREIDPEGIDLLVAGLLHDIGKGLPSLAQRVVFVLAEAVWPKDLDRWATIPRRSFRGGLWALAHQAEAGARFLEIAGSRPRVAEIVRKQGNPEDPDTALLARIDAQC